MKRQDFIVSGSALAAGLAVGGSGSAHAAVANPAFAFRSNFWVNLHHTLYYQAQVLEAVYGTGASHLSPMDRDAFADLKSVPTASEHDWFSALCIYRKNYTFLDFVFSDAMAKIDNTLAETDGRANPRGLALPAPLLQAFDLAAPIYRASQWHRDDARNRAFIASLKHALARFGSECGPRLAQIYRTPWLPEPYRVDVMPYAERDGSYSNNADSFVHIAMSTQDSGERGAPGLDVLYHEASHSTADPEYGTIGSAITAAAKRANRPAPDQFWHAVIFYTPGKIVEKLLDGAGLGPYAMFAKSEGLFTRDWPRYYDALERHWQPYMDGQGTLQAALADCVNQIVAV